MPPRRTRPRKLDLSLLSVSPPSPPEENQSQCPTTPLSTSGPSGFQPVTSPLRTSGPGFASSPVSASGPSGYQYTSSPVNLSGLNQSQYSASPSPQRPYQSRNAVTPVIPPRLSRSLNAAPPSPLRSCRSQHALSPVSALGQNLSRLSVSPSPSRSPHSRHAASPMSPLRPSQSDLAAAQGYSGPSRSPIATSSPSGPNQFATSPSPRGPNQSQRARPNASDLSHSQHIALLSPSRPCQPQFAASPSPRRPNQSQFAEQNTSGLRQYPLDTLSNQFQKALSHMNSSGTSPSHLVSNCVPNRFQTTGSPSPSRPNASQCGMSPNHSGRSQSQLTATPSPSRPNAYKHDMSPNQLGISQSQFQASPSPARLNHSQISVLQSSFSEKSQPRPNATPSPSRPNQSQFAASPSPSGANRSVHAKSANYSGASRSQLSASRNLSDLFRNASSPNNSQPNGSPRSIPESRPATSPSPLGKYQPLLPTSPKSPRVPTQSRSGPSLFQLLPISGANPARAEAVLRLIPSPIRHAPIPSPSKFASSSSSPTQVAGSYSSPSHSNVSQPSLSRSTTPMRSVPEQASLPSFAGPVMPPEPSPCHLATSQSSPFAGCLPSPSAPNPLPSLFSRTCHNSPDGLSFISCFQRDSRSGVFYFWLYHLDHEKIKRAEDIKVNVDLGKEPHKTFFSTNPFPLDMSREQVWASGECHEISNAKLAKMLDGIRLSVHLKFRDSLSCPMPPCL